MLTLTNMSTLILFVLLHKCSCSSSNKDDAQLSRTEKELLNLLEYILNLRKDLQQERIERKESIEALNRTISHSTQDSLGFRPTISEYCGLKKMESLQKGLQREKTLRIMAEKRVDTLEKKLQLFEDNLKLQKAMVITLEDNIGHVHSSVGSLKVDMNNISTDVRSTKKDLGERLSNFETRVKIIEKDVENKITKVLARSQHVVVSGLQRSTLTTFREGQKIVFDEIYENLGNSYQSSTGVFAAPVAGLYIILLAISSDHNPTPVVDVVRNGATLCRTVMAVLSSWSVSPCTAVVHLNQGDQIWAQVSGLHYRSHTIRGDLFSSFSIGLFSPD